MTKLLVIVAGFHGVGKSTVGRRLAKDLPATLFDMNTLSSEFVAALLEAHDIAPHEQYDKKVYTQQIRPLAYHQMEGAGFENLAYGRHVVLAAPYEREMTWPKWHERMSYRASAYNASLQIVWVRCDDDEAYRRVSARDVPLGGWKRSSWKKYSSGVEWDFAPAFPHHLIDNSEHSEDREPEDQVDDLAHRLTVLAGRSVNDPDSL